MARRTQRGTREADIQFRRNGTLVAHAVNVDHGQWIIEYRRSKRSQEAHVQDETGRWIVDGMPVPSLVAEVHL